MKRTLFRIAAVLCIALAAFFLMPVFGGILHFGMIWPAAVLLPAAAVLLRPAGIIRVTFGRTFSTLSGLKNSSGNPGPSLS